MRRAARALAVGVAGMLGAVAASAAPVSPVGLQVWATGGYYGSYDETDLGCVPGTGDTFVCSGSGLVLGDLEFDLWTMTFDVDPVVTGTTAVTNNNPLASQQFTLLFTLPVAPMGPFTLSGGSIQGGVTDNNGDGATLSTAAGSAFYQGLIDGGSAAARTLYADPYSLSAANFLSNNVPNVAFGTPIPSLPSPAVSTNIGIRLDFVLTPLDSASFTSNFVVVVPEPATGALLALGLVALGLRRRR